MKHKKQRSVVISIVGSMIVMALVGWLTPAEAGLSVQTIVGQVDMTPAEGQPWRPLTKEMTLAAGNYIRTGPASEAGLLGEDGSTLLIGENTELAIAQLDYSEPEQKRVSRFKLLWGKLTGKAKRLTFKENAFEVETAAVVAGFKFSSATITATKDGGTDVLLLTGKHEFARMEQLNQKQPVAVRYVENEGLEYNVDLPPLAEVATEVGSLTVTNYGTSSITITIKDANGNVIGSVEIPAGVTARTRVDCSNLNEPCELIVSFSGGTGTVNDENGNPIANNTIRFDRGETGPTAEWAPGDSIDANQPSGSRITP